MRGALLIGVAFNCRSFLLWSASEDSIAELYSGAQVHIVL
jgi:hypothetical protein